MFKPGGPTFVELMRQALSGTTEGYDMLAPKFDATPFRTPPEMLETVAEVIGEPVESALDACCGTGAGLIMLRPLTTGRLVGVDLSQGMLDEAARRLDEVGGDAEVELVQGDANELGFDQRFDLVTSFGAFGHIEERDQPRFIEGIARALKPGGRFVFVTSEKPGPLDPTFWALHGFNAVMRARNHLIDPPFIMYYLNFCVPDILPMFHRAGFEVELHERRYEIYRYVIAVATKRP